MGIKGSQDLRTSGIPTASSLFYKYIQHSLISVDSLFEKHPSAVCALLSGSENTLKGTHLKDVVL